MTVTSLPNSTSTIPARRISGFARKVSPDGWLEEIRVVKNRWSDLFGTGPSRSGTALFEFLPACGLHRSRSFLCEQRLICRQEVLADLCPLQLILNPSATVGP